MSAVKIHATTVFLPDPRTLYGVLRPAVYLLKSDPPKSMAFEPMRRI
jgi:hypothetical protein